VAEKVVTMLDALNPSPEQQAAVPTLLQLYLGTIDMNAIEAPPSAIKPR